MAALDPTPVRSSGMSLAAAGHHWRARDRHRCHAPAALDRRRVAIVAIAASPRMPPPDREPPGTPVTRSLLRPLRSSAPLSFLAAALLTPGAATAGDSGRRFRERRRHPAVDRSRRRDPEPRPRDLHRAGEPVVRSLLRHVPRRDGIPLYAGRPLQRLHPGPGVEQLPPPLPRHEPVRSGRPHGEFGVGDLGEPRKMNGFVAVPPRDRQRLHEAPERLRLPDRPGPGPSGHPRRDGFPHEGARSRTTGPTRSASCCRTGCSPRPTRGRSRPTCTWCRRGRRPAPTSRTR